MERVICVHTCISNRLLIHIESTSGNSLVDFYQRKEQIYPPPPSFSL